jgi:hypothetical protein
MEEETAYFQRRASEETTAAAKAQHPNAREAHLRMAQSYQDLVSSDVR